MREGNLTELKRRIAELLTQSRAGQMAERLEVRLMDGTYQEIVAVTYPADRNVVLFIAQPLDYEERMLAESQKRQEARKTGDAP